MIVWVDTETTGLDETVGHLLEVALVVTNNDLDEVAHTSVLVKPVTAGTFYDDVVMKLDPVVYAMHEKSGLLREVEALGAGNRPTEVAMRLVNWLINVVAGYAASGVHVDAGGLEPGEILKKNTPLAGSTVGFDRAWLRWHMPEFESMFHYRSIDVSSITELAARWAPAIYEGRPKADPDKVAHRALSDARESIGVLRYYRECGFIGGDK